MRERGAIDAIQRVVNAGVRVSLGHTEAVAADVTAAADAGATCVTHIFNAQRPLGHREPGVPGQALADPRFTIGLIADLHHVAAQICTVVLRAASGRVALVTDATAAAGMPPGRYRLADVPVHVHADGEPPRRGDGRLAGSSLTLDAAIRNLVSIGIDLVQAVEAASRVPADALGRSDLGRIAPGAKPTWSGGRPTCGRSAPGCAASRSTVGSDRARARRPRPLLPRPGCHPCER